MKLRNNTEAKVKKLYTSFKEPGAFRGLSAFIKSNNLEESHQLVKKTLLSLSPYSLHRTAKDKFPRRRVQVNFGNWQHLSDILDNSRYTKVNNNYRYILIVQDSFTRKLFLEPLKTKRPQDVIEAFKKIYKRTPIPKLLNTDMGSEYTSKVSENYFKSLGITRFNSFSSIKV